MTKIFAIIVLVVWSGVVLAMRDPTEPIDCQYAKNSRCNNRLTVSSVIITPYRRVAVINDRSYREHDKVGEMTIEKIEPGKVILVGKAGKRVLLVNQLSHQAIVITKY